MEVVGKQIYENWFTANYPMKFHWNGQDVELVDIERRDPVEEECIAVKSKMKFLDSDAKDLFLCKNGEILFRVEG